jgi:hypothetical protein
VIEDVSGDPGSSDAAGSSSSAAVGGLRAGLGFMNFLGGGSAPRAHSARAASMEAGEAAAAAAMAAATGRGSPQQQERTSDFAAGLRNAAAV